MPDYEWYKRRPPTLWPFPGGYLRPFTYADLENWQLMNTMKVWRKCNTEAYPSRPHNITDTSFLNWAEAMLDKKDRILFLVLDNKQVPVGHLGYNNGNEIDNVVRGDSSAPKGIMSEAMRAVLTWGEDVCFLEDIYLRVFLDNRHAIEFYERLGFTHGEWIPLALKHYEWGDAYEPTDGEANKIFLRMHYQPESKGQIWTSGPSISQREVEYAADATYQLNKDYTGYIRKLEQKACDYLGCKYAIATSSCTGALTLALRSLPLYYGDLVAVPDITWVATASVVDECGQLVHFSEVSANTWGMDARDTEGCDASIPVHLYGIPINVSNCQGHIIEDAAAALGAELNGMKVGTLGDIGCFSFQGAKLVTSGEGGLFVTDDEKIYQRALLLSNHGRHGSNFDIIERGHKFKMSNVQAAVALAQLERIDDLLWKKRVIRSWYEEMLGETLRFQRPLKNSKPTYWMVSCILPDEVNRDAFREELRKDGIDTRPAFPRISTYPIWGERAAPSDHFIADTIATLGINLPSGVTLKRRDVERIAKSIRKAIHA